MSVEMRKYLLNLFHGFSDIQRNHIERISEGILKGEIKWENRSGTYDFGVEGLGYLGLVREIEPTISAEDAVLVSRKLVDYFLSDNAVDEFLLKYEYVLTEKTLSENWKDFTKLTAENIIRQLYHSQGQ